LDLYSTQRDQSVEAQKFERREVGDYDTALAGQGRNETTRLVVAAYDRHKELRASGVAAKRRKKKGESQA
jgi:hypothetical protein